MVIKLNITPTSVINTKFKKQLNQKTPLSTTQIFNKTILT
ncbi:hypothetical protein BCLUESOX_824 [bacterium endosymbiont of Bathymodiolus sp. 5 South]|nr:hypothetical protein [uncultured Gammaproteobacteria bacterium]SHN93641.1 hypothetical protein BCLUESOX_824 [bacterium endosymbiont of Bathymodiolus sp. 5 South]